MKTYYRVKSVISDRGNDRIFYAGEVQSETMPECTFEHGRTGDFYMDYFESEEEALAFVAEQRRCL